MKNRRIQMIAVGGSIGTGLFLGTGGHLAQGGSALTFVYVVCGAFAFLMARTLGELAVRCPSSGVFVSYAREFLSEKSAFVTGWFFFLDWAVTVMADITAVALYMHYWSMFKSVPQWVIVLVALALVFVLNMVSVKAFGEAEFRFAMIKVAMTLIFMGVATWAIVTQTHVGEYTADLCNISESDGWFPGGLAPVFALALGVVSAFGGTEMVDVVAGEAKDATTILSKAISSMIVRIFFFHVSSVVPFVLVPSYNAYSSSESPLATFLSGLGAPHAGDIIQAIVLIVVLSSLNVGLCATGHMLRSMALVGEGPRCATRLNKNHVPYDGIIITISLGLLGVSFGAFVLESTFNIVMSLAGIGIAGTWAMILISYLVFPCRVKRGEEQRPEFHMPGTPYTNYLALFFFVVVVASNVASESGHWTLVLFAVAVALMVAGWYYVRGHVGNLTDKAATSL